MTTKTCPYCAEEIQEDAIKCKHCGSMLAEEKQIKQKKKRNINPAAVVVVIILVVIVGTAGWYYYYGPCGKIPVEKTIELFDEIFDDWYDTNRLASSTSRIALSGPLKDLQDIGDRFENVDAPECLWSAQSVGILAIETSIEGYIAFATQETDTVVTNKFEASGNYIERFFRHIIEVQECYPFCFDY